MPRPVARAALAIALGLFALTSNALAQDTTYSLQEYLELQSRADEAVAAWQGFPEGDPARVGAAETALAERMVLLDYLADWTWSGELPADMADSAFEARLVLLQNVVTLQVELGDCDAAEETTGRVEALAEERAQSELAGDARTEAWAAVGRCRVLQRERAEVVTEVAPDPEPEVIELDPPTEEPTPDEAILAELVTEPADEATTSERRGGGALPWILMGTGTVVAAAGVGVVLGPLAESNEDIRTWNANHAPGADETEINETHTTAENQRMVASVLVGTGAAMATAGVLTLIFRDKGDAADVSAWVTPQGGMVSVGWRW